MPREHVESCWKDVIPHQVIDGEVAAAGDPLPNFRVEVGWDKGGFAQIATINPAALVGTLESGLYVDLDRQKINDLIRLLRKARDQAFGRDE